MSNNKKKKTKKAKKDWTSFFAKSSTYIKKLLTYIALFVGYAGWVITKYSAPENGGLSLEQTIKFSLVVAVILLTTSFSISYLSSKGKEEIIDAEVSKRVEELLKCQNCMNKMLDIQKQLINSNLLDSFKNLTVSDLEKINTLIHAMEIDNTLNDGEMNKLQAFVDVLLEHKALKRIPSYIVMSDMKVIENNVDDESEIHIISSSVSCDDELKDSIIANLKRGVQYNYYIPASSEKDISFKSTLSNITKNIQSWYKDDAIDFDMISNQVHVYRFPKEYMQMSMTFYDYQRRTTSDDTTPKIIVKFPSVSPDISNRYPLFFYVENEPSLINPLSDVLNNIYEISSECALKMSKKGIPYIG